MGADSARTQFYALLDDVARGQTITITRRGSPVAQLIPVDAAALSADRLLDEMRAFRKGNSLRGLSICELINEGRKY
jgi:prevent-host-death family protein